MPTAHCYIRATTKLARETQEQALRSYFAAKVEPEGFAWGGVFVDGPSYGGKRFANRPAGLRCGTALDRGDVLLASTLAVAFVSTEDLRTTLAVWRARGVELVVVDLGIDSRTEEGRRQLEMLAAVAELQQAAKVERVRAAHAKRKAAGVHGGGRAPIGRKYVGEHGKRRLANDKQERALVMQMVRWADTLHCTPREIYFWLRKLKVKRRGTGQPWSISAIVRALEAGRRWLAEEAMGANQEAGQRVQYSSQMDQTNPPDVPTTGSFQ